MNKITRDYREAQFERVSTPYSEYKPKLKIIKPNGETNWLDIEESELVQIRDLLLGIPTPSPRRLPTATIGGQEYFIDFKLRQIRAVDNPHDFHSFNSDRARAIRIADIRVPEPSPGEGVRAGGEHG